MAVAQADKQHELNLLTTELDNVKLVAKTTKESLSTALANAVAEAKALAVQLENVRGDACDRAFVEHQLCCAGFHWRRH